MTSGRSTRPPGGAGQLGGACDGSEVAWLPPSKCSPARRGHWLLSRRLREDPGNQIHPAMGSLRNNCSKSSGLPIHEVWRSRRRSGRSSTCLSPSWTRGRVARGPPRRLWPSVGAASPPSIARQAWRSVRSAGGSRSSPRPTDRRGIGCGVLAVAARPPRRRIRVFSRIWRLFWSPPRVGIPSVRCGGQSRAFDVWPQSWSEGGTP